MTTPTAAEPEQAPVADDYSYLNGAQSPFFQSTGKEPGDKTPTPTRPGLFDDSNTIAPGATRAGGSAAP